jgi:hypothetical protein
MPLFPTASVIVGVGRAAVEQVGGDGEAGVKHRLVGVDGVQRVDAVAGHGQGGADLLAGGGWAS